jgi:hypothetical protein
MNPILFETVLLLKTIFLEAAFLQVDFLQTSWADGDRHSIVGGSI